MIDDIPMGYRADVSSRFVSNLTVLILGAVLAMARFPFGDEAARWLAFSAGASVSVVIAAAFLVRGRGPAQRVLDVIGWLLGSWCAVSALTFRAPTVGWLALGDGIGLAVLGTIGLIAHEVVMERACRPAVALGEEQDGRPEAIASARSHIAAAPWPG